jgi:hypothetical protein
MMGEVIRHQKISIDELIVSLDINSIARTIHQKMMDSDSIPFTLIIPQ